MSTVVLMADIKKVNELLAQAVQHFEATFKERPSCASCAPGRVNLIGEHTDYNDGFVFPMALPLMTVLVGRATDSGICRVVTVAEHVDEPRSVEFQLPKSEADLQRGHPLWANYIKGIIAFFPQKDLLPSFDAVITTSVPVGGGLSSSASLEVAMFSLLEALISCNLSVQHHSPVILPMDKARCCQRAEHVYANMPCGIMDQFIATMGKAGHALLIDCRSLKGELVPLDSDEVAVLIINSNVRHELSASEYPLRRQQCERAAQLLNCHKLRDATLADLEAAKAKMDDMVYRRARHVISENQRCIDAAAALKSADYVTFGQLMTASHQSLRDDYEVSCAELDELVTLATSVSGVLGSRMTGGGFGGCTVSLVLVEAVDRAVDYIKNQYRGNAEFYVCQAADGASQLPLSC